MANTQFEIWLELTNKSLEIKHNEQFSSLEYTPLTYSKGRKFIKILKGGAVWGFVSMINGFNKEVPIKLGDLLKPASFNTPARHARGNIFNGTAKFTAYGPHYLK